MDKIGNVRFLPELGATLFGARWTCGNYTLELLHEHVIATHDSSVLRGMSIRCARLVAFRSVVCCSLLMVALDKSREDHGSTAANDRIPED